MKFPRRVFNEKFFSMLFKLFVLVVVIFVFYTQYSNSTVTNNIDKRLTDMERRLAEQDKIISQVKHNPNSLHMCMNDAAKEWSNYLKTHAYHVTPPGPGQTDPSYSITEEERGKANAQLQAAQKSCEASFGE